MSVNGRGGCHQENSGRWRREKETVALTRGPVLDEAYDAVGLCAGSGLEVSGAGVERHAIVAGGVGQLGVVRVAHGDLKTKYPSGHTPFPAPEQ